MTVDNPLFRESVVTPIEENRYLGFGLSQNPFPDKPTVVPDSSDPRLNGEIYNAELRSNEQLQFERLLVPGQERPEAVPIALLMDYATRRGRGIGKTAFLNNQRRRIMRDLGGELTGGAYVLVAAHVVPEGGGNTRKFWQFTQQIAAALNTGYCISWAIWRLRAKSSAIDKDLLLEIDPQDLESTIGDDEWLAQRGVQVFWSLNPDVTQMLIAAGIGEKTARILADNGANPSQLQKHFFDAQKAAYWRNEGHIFVFDDLVRLFRAAGINHALLLVDEVEKIVVPQNSQERRAFVDDIRRFFVDGPFQSVYARFYNLLLTIHPYIQEIWMPHWKAAGLDRVCPISGGATQDFTIYFEPLDEKTTAVPLVLSYLDYFRTSEDLKGQLVPFDADAVVEALKRSGGVPGHMLMMLRIVLERAVSQGWDHISRDQVRNIYESAIPAEPPEEEELTPLPTVKTDLLGS